MAEETSYVYLRLADGIRHSRVEFEEIEQLAETELHNDDRDRSVYFFALPSEIDNAQANRIISALVNKSYIDEAWTNSKATAKVMPLVSPD